jgi:type II secretory pathway component GspD/PulD (secretin)
MRSKLGVILWIGGLLALAGTAATARGQTVIVSPAVTVTSPGSSLSVQTTVRVPDGGSALVAGYSSLSESRTEFGPPGLSGVPYLNRAVRNVAYGRRTVARRVYASVRIIDLREEEYRQTGYRSP